MENIAAKYLHPGEEVRWTGGPDDFSLLGKTTKGPVLLNWCVTGALTVLFLTWYFLVLCSGTFSPVFVGLVLAVAATVMYLPVKKYRDLRGARYCITDERAVLITGDESYYCVELKNLDGVRRLQDAEGRTSLLLGVSPQQPPKRGLDWRSRTVKPAVRTEGRWDYAESLLFSGPRTRRAPWRPCAPPASDRGPRGQGPQRQKPIPEELLPESVFCPMCGFPICSYRARRSRSCPAPCRRCAVPCPPPSPARCRRTSPAG